MPIRPDMATRYPSDWQRRRRFIIQHRARNRCEWCGAENGLPHPATGSDVVLTLAHVWDKRPENASLLNLAALCQRCHNRHDAADRLESRRRRHLAMLMLQGQIPLCLPPADSLAMAIYDELVRKGVVGMPPQREFQMSFPAEAWEWMGAGTATRELGITPAAISSSSKGSIPVGGRIVR